VWGSASFAQQLVENDLVDEYRLMVEPILLGGGKTIFPSDGQARPLDLVSVTQAKTGVLICAYRPAAAWGASRSRTKPVPASRTAAPRCVWTARHPHPAVPRRLPLSELDAEAIEAFKEHEIAERARILAAREAGEQIRDPRGRPRRTLSNGSINKLLILLTAILKNAQRRGLIEANPATAIYRYQRAGRPQRVGVADPGRRALVATLGCAGLRVSEAAELDLADIDLARGWIHVRNAKTPAGERYVHVTDRLAAELRAYLATRAGEPLSAPAFPTRTGGRRDKDNIRNRVLAPALGRANELRARRDLPPIDAHVTPHTLRRTYISIMLTAGADVAYVQAQVGHRDPTLTLRVYARVLQRRDRRQFGAAFDQLMREAIPSMQHANMHTSRPLPKAA
jgi:integrase